MSILKFWKAACCFAWMPLRLGGDSSSSQTTSPVTTTTTNVTSQDRRNVASENAQAISGNNSLAVRNDTTTINMTDGGSVKAALDGITTLGSKAIDLGQFSVGGAIDTVKAVAQNNQQTIQDVFDLAKQTGANSLTSAAQTMGLATSTAQLAADAYKNASDSSTGNRTLLLVGMGVIGVAAVAMMMHKG
ncbi:hypothetical protein CAter10_2512 [Collimonas arenae]|uniref:hypothetical protein n=1 Tax=Collimonas arenae TaxID=279058 RepID=UPI00077859E5|nr:hypothetical protein [Collimonas arenae]AMP00158.1 hypothetical protein CAter10_2512 [Collimonas arenae]